MPPTSEDLFATVEATVTSKGQVTLPSELRKKLGLHKGSRIRFSMPSRDVVNIEAVRYSIQDLWKMADEDGRPKEVMSFVQMNAAKIRQKV